VLLLGLLDLGLLILASEVAWQWRAHQIGMDLGALSAGGLALLGTAMVIWLAMIAVGVYGPNALRSLRFAGARLLVAISLGIIALAVVDFLIRATCSGVRRCLRDGPCDHCAGADRLLLNSFLGSSAFRRRVMVLGAGPRAQRLREAGRKARKRLCHRRLYRMSESQPRGRGSDPALGDPRSGRFVENLGVSAKWCLRWRSGATRCR
jgi:hypothetical protein